MKDTKKTRIITIAGKPGSGKSTASKAVAMELGYEHFSSGDLFRAIGKELGADVHQTNVLANQQHHIDQVVDQRLVDIGEKQERVVIDSRLAWHWIPNSFKVYLDLDLSIAAKRILANIDPKRMENEHIPNNATAYTQALEARLGEETRRYLEKYQADPYKLSNYDLVIDSAKNGPEEVTGMILSEYRKWLDGRKV